MSPKEQEAELRTEEDFKRYYYSLYRCLPNEKNDFNNRRNQIRIKYPELVILFGNYFVLTGNAACEVLSTYYYSLSLLEDYNDEEKNYYIERYETVKEKHRKSQSLDVPINLTEGQLGTDNNIEFYVKEAVINKLLTVWEPK
jgi:hypothetical protein